ncbi:MAG: hypothetical protein IPL50_12040 [Chitinophagaceae bacterium]|nr:hypothetical protein [Chitinophagaceae bacterium]
MSADVNANCWLPTIMTEKQKEVLKILNDHKMQSRPFWVLHESSWGCLLAILLYNKNASGPIMYKRCFKYSMLNEYYQ